MCSKGGLDGREDGEYKDDGFVNISKISEIQDAIFFRKAACERV